MRKAPVWAWATWPIFPVRMKSNASIQTGSAIDCTPTVTTRPSMTVYPEDLKKAQQDKQVMERVARIVPMKPSDEAIT